MDFYTNYGKRPKLTLSYNSGELKVEAAGYRPAYKEIASMIISGQSFEKSREDFQYQDEASIEKEVNHVDTYDKDVFEMIDAAREASRSLGESIEAAKAAKKKADRDAEIEVIRKELQSEAAAEAQKDQSKAAAAAPTKEGQ